MSTVTPPPPPTPPTPPSAPPPTATVASPPPALTSLPIGTTVEAQIQAQAQTQAQGTRPVIQVQTAYGTLQLQLSAPIPKTAVTLLLALQTLTPAPVFQVAAIDGRPTTARPTTLSPQDGAKPTATPPPGGARGTAPATTSLGTPSGSPGTSGGVESLRFSAALPGAVLGARVLTPTPGAAIATANASPAGASQPSSGHNTATAPTGATATTKTRTGILGRLFGAAPANKPAPGFGPAAATAAGSPASQAHPLMPGTGLEVRIANLLAPTPGAKTSTGPAFTGTTDTIRPTASAGTAPGTQMNATISGRTSQGLPVANTPLGTMALATRTPLAPGTQILLEVTAEPPRPPINSLTGALWLREGMAQSGAGWANLDEALDVLAKAAPDIHQALIKTALPSANNRLASNMLFFLAALRGGDVRGWMGEGALRILNARAPDVLSRLGDDFTQLSRTADEPASGEWRLTTLPFFTGEAIEPVRLFQRNRKQDNDDGEDPENTRFILDVNLSRLGHLQLDGLVRSEHKHVDLIVRTERPLPLAIRHDIMDIFKDAGELTGMTGGLAFQAAPDALIDVSDNGTARLPANLNL